MTTHELNENLNKALVAFSEEMNPIYTDYDNTPATNADISELARHTFYVADNFRKEIIAYLESNK